MPIQVRERDASSSWRGTDASSRTRSNALYADEIAAGRYVCDYVHLSRATVVPGTLQHPLSSNDLLLPDRGVASRAEERRLLLQKAGLSERDPEVRADRVPHFAGVEDRSGLGGPRQDAGDAHTSCRSRFYEAIPDPPGNFGATSSSWACSRRRENSSSSMWAGCCEHPVAPREISPLERGRRPR